MKHAALAEPLSICCHVVKRGQVKADDYVVVIGGGPIGLMTALVARVEGAHVVVSEVNENRVNKAASLGLEVVNPMQTDVVAYVKEATDGAGADVVFETSGSQPGVDTMVLLPKVHGRVVLVAIYGHPMTVDLKQLYYYEKELTTARMQELEDFEKAVKLLDELEHEFRLIERRRQGLCKPNLLYVKDLYAGLSQSNYWKYENHTSGSLKNELPGVLKSNGSNTEKINKTDSSETDLIYPAELQEEEQYRRYFKEALELEILEQSYPADKAVLYEILELLVETVTSRKKFLRICGEEKPREVVKSRLMKLDSSHIQYILECLKENSTQIRNIKQYLLATLYNAPVTVDSYYSAQVRHEFGWSGRVDKN